MVIGGDEEEDMARGLLHLAEPRFHVRLKGPHEGFAKNTPGAVLDTLGNQHFVSFQLGEGDRSDPSAKPFWIDADLVERTD